jgi:hypothetical protein
MAAQIDDNPNVPIFRTFLMGYKIDPAEAVLAAEGNLAEIYPSFLDNAARSPLL